MKLLILFVFLFLSLNIFSGASASAGAGDIGGGPSKLKWAQILKSRSMKADFPMMQLDGHHISVDGICLYDTDFLRSKKEVDIYDFSGYYGEVTPDEPTSKEFVFGPVIYKEKKRKLKYKIEVFEVGRGELMLGRRLFKKNYSITDCR